MQRVVSLFWRWRWLLALLLVVAVSASYYLRWRSEEKRIATLLAQGEQAIVDRDYPAAREHLTAYLDARRKTLACDGSWPMSRGGCAFTSRPERRCVRAGNQEATTRRSRPNTGADGGRAG